MKHKFSGWNTVFGFTFRQTSNGIRFKIVTALIALLILGACIVINLFVAKSDTDKDVEIEISPIKKVFILDESGFEPVLLKDFNPELSTEVFKDIQYINLVDRTRTEVVKEAGADSTESIAVIITKEEGNNYAIELAIPDQSTITESQAWVLIPPLQSAFETSKLLQSGLTEEQLAFVLTPTVTSYTEVGEETNLAVILVKMLAPALFGLILYMMLLQYGQNISKSVSIEKTSKLMEALLTSIHPYALITGKVLAITCVGLIQFSIWIASIIIGLFAGNAITQSVYPEYQNTVVTIVEFFRDNMSDTALSLPSGILALIVFCIGFLFYCTMAGVSGCLVSKPEDVATTQSLFVFPIIISWLVCYLGSLMGNVKLMSVVRYIPFTTPFSVPVDLITGVMTIGEGIIALLILAIFTLFFIMCSARLYKGMVLYTGQKLSLKLAINIIRAKQ